MKLREYQELLKTDPNDLGEQMKVLGKDINKMSVKAMNKELDKHKIVDFSASYKKYLWRKGRVFRVVNDVDKLKGGEYAYFKQVMGDVVAKNVDAEGNTTEKTDPETILLLFGVAHKILAVFLKEKTFWKKHLSFMEKQEFLLDTDMKDVVSLVFFLLRGIRDLVRRITIFYLNKIKKEKQKPPQKKEI